MTDRDIDGGMAGAVQAQENESLAALISRYLIRLGLDSAFTSGIIVPLLTKGKVRVDFSKVVERLELINRNACMMAPQAMELFEDYMTSMRSEEDLTQKAKPFASRCKIRISKPSSLARPTPPVRLSGS